MKNSNALIVTMEISVYPLKDEFEDSIISFIENIRKYPDVMVRTHAMSTYIKGDFKLIMNMLTTELAKIYRHIDTSSTIIKIINRDLPIEDGFYGSTI